MKEADTPTKGSIKKDSKFAKHAQDDAAVAPPPASPGMQANGMPLFVKVLIFIIFPTFMGILGLYMGYLAKRNDPARELSFDTDFALPFLLTLCMCVVIAFQTGGFTSNKPKPLIKWPKIKKRRKIVHKHVVVGQNPEEVEGIPEKDYDTKNDTKKTN